MSDGNLTTQFEVVLTADRLGMQLSDAYDGLGVEVTAFTNINENGDPGAAER